MNQRIRELSEQALEIVSKKRTLKDCLLDRVWDPHEYDQVFAELIVRECIKTIEYRAPGQMGEVGKGWTNGYDDGLKTGAWLLKEHFGVKA